MIPGHLVCVRHLHHLFFSVSVLRDMAEVPRLWICHALSSNPAFATSGPCDLQKVMLYVENIFVKKKVILNLSIHSFITKMW